MAFKYDSMRPRVIPQWEQELVNEDKRLFQELHTHRNTFAMMWEETSELIAPNYRNTFYYGTFNWPGQKKTERQIDASGMLANARFGAICDSLLTPRNMFWHGLAPDDDELLKDREVREWLDKLKRVLFKYRYAPEANFASQNQMVYQLLGAFGTGGMFIDGFDDPTRVQSGFRYKALPLGQLFIRENHQGLIDTIIRWWRMTARQAEQKFPGMLPANMASALQQQREFPYNFLHVVKPNEEWDPRYLDERGKRFISHYISMEADSLLRRPGGYHTLPYAITRYEQFPDEVYGRGPAQMVLPALKTLNAQKGTFLKQGHRASDPVLLTHDDGLVDFVNRPGALNKGGMSAEGRRLVDILPSGNIQINEKMMDMERSLINDAFLVTLFQILTETPQMTATEVIERTNEKGILLAPTIGRQQSEYLGPLLNREIDLAMQQRLMPPMPDALRRALGRYHPVYTSPLARAQRAGEAAGFIRVVETAKEIVNITQDPSYLDPFDFDTALPEISADIQNVPPRWMAPDAFTIKPRSVAEKRKSRADAQQRKEQIDAMPAQAAMMKAQNKVQQGEPGIAPGMNQGMGGPVPRRNGAMI